jgi:hypothetical protein
MRSKALGFLMAVVVASGLSAGSLADVTLPETVTVAGTTLQLNGMGVRKKMVFKIYVAGMYLEQKTSVAEQALAATGPKRIVLHFVSNKATKKRMDEAWLEGFKANSPDTFAAIKDRIDTFIAFFGDMKDGDVIECTVIPGEGTSVVLNGDGLGTIDGDEFATALLRIWLGPKPPSDDLKDALLGAG